MIDTIISGTRNLLKLISVTKTTRFVNLSSGAIYGRCSNGSVRFAETFCGGPDLSNSLNAYHEAKRLSELLVRIECDKIGVSHVSLRLFTFIAPYLPLNTHFAAGNFILNALRGEDIVVQSGGGSIRTFQYGSDLTKYLICALTRDLRHDVYNVGSPTPFTVRELAEVVRNCLNPDGKVKIAGVDSDLNFSVYVPEVKRVVEEFGFTDSISLEAAVMRTASWYSKRVIT
jgi:dTDP-glucose 4,6-dehydratase